MSVAPEHYRAARHGLPRLPLPAVLAFGVVGFGGALFLAYSSFSAPETTPSLASATEVPVYAARAVPLDPQPYDFAQRAISIARALCAASNQSQQPETSDAGVSPERTGPTLLSDASAQLEGFGRFASARVANNYLALTGATFGISAQMSPSGFVAPDAETAVSAAVPEASTWLCGAALLALVVARGIYASWHRNQRRVANKSDSEN